MTWLRASFGTYGFGYSRSTLSLTFHPRLSADDKSTTLTRGMTAGRHDLGNYIEILLLDRRHCLEAMEELHVEDVVGWIQQHVLAPFIVSKVRVAISKAEELKLSKLSSKVTELVRHDSRFVDLMKKILYIAIAFQTEYCDKFVATIIVEIVKSTMSS